MSRSFRLTRRAEASLVEIARWTIDNFGLKQAELYETELLSRCQAILNGRAHSRSCAVLVDDAEDLRFVRAGEHFLVFLDRPDEVIIVDNRRFQQLCSHYLVDPVACTPAAGWEKGQVENQVGVIRRRFFVPRPRFKSLAEFNSWLMDRCVAWARTHPHPEFRERTTWDVFEEELSRLVPYAGSFDGYHAVPASVSKTCLVRFDKNRYSVEALAVGRPVEIRAYAERVEFWQDGQVVGEHARSFSRDTAIYGPLHYIPVLARKPGALRNGAPFKDWDLPPAMRRVQHKLGRVPNGDRQMVDILSAILTDGLDAVEAACAEALSEGVHSSAVVLNILARRSYRHARSDAFGLWTGFAAELTA